MNKHITDIAVQEYIQKHLHADVHTIAMAKSPFPLVSGQELSAQIAAKKKSAKKLPSWFNTTGILYPSLLSIEQCSSETTAAYKAGLAKGINLIDLTGGFGVDSYYFSKTNASVTHCEINEDLSAIAACNAPLLKQQNTDFVAGDGLAFIKNNETHYGTVYIDPARRSGSGKVFMLKDCTPDVTTNMDLLLDRAERILIKTAPLLDITAGMKELNHVAEIHIVSVKNECKELIWVVEPGHARKTKIVCSTLNAEQKQFSFFIGEEGTATTGGTVTPGTYLYEPDVALLKSGAFNLIADRYKLQKFHSQTQLYISSEIHTEFPGRIFKIEELLSSATLKKDKGLKGSVIVRNYPDKAALLVNKYRITPDDHQFIIFTQSAQDGKLIIRGTIIQHY